MPDRVKGLHNTELWQECDRCKEYTEVYLRQSRYVCAVCCIDILHEIEERADEIAEKAERMAMMTDATSYENAFDELYDVVKGLKGLDKGGI